MTEDCKIADEDGPTVSCMQETRRLVRASAILVAGHSEATEVTEPIPLAPLHALRESGGALVDAQEVPQVLFEHM
jgi:hypothetical protein